jgi:hypothetical protein
MLLHMNGKFTWDNWNHLFCRKVSFFAAPHCQFRSVAWPWTIVGVVFRGCYNARMSQCQNISIILRANEGYKKFTQLFINSTVEIAWAIFRILAFCRFHGRIYPFICSVNASPVNSICHHQISNWCREIFKYNTVISYIWIMHFYRYIVMYLI